MTLMESALPIPVIGTGRRRFGRIARLRPGAEDEYKRLHGTVWPEVLGAIAQAGIRNYTIYFHEGWVFSHFELVPGTTLEDAYAAMRRSSACELWEEKMRCLRDPAFAVDWRPMEEIFHQEIP